MSGQTMQFVDGKSYETMMGLWSAEVGNIFLDWLGASPGLRWLDVGCGNGASTELLVKHVAPSHVEAIDPSEAQLDFARKRHKSGVANFRLGSASDLPFPEHDFDAALMALVIFFVLDASRAVSEMVRVVRPGGSIGAYAWDIFGGGFPYHVVHRAMEAAGHEPIRPPHPEAAELLTMEKLWKDAGLEGVETRSIEVSRTYPSFEDYWAVSNTAPGIGPVLASLGQDEVTNIRSAAEKITGPGPVTISARTNAVKGKVAH